MRVGFGWWAAVKADGGIFGAGWLGVLVGVFIGLGVPVVDAAGCVPRTPSATEFDLDTSF